MDLKKLKKRKKVLRLYLKTGKLLEGLRSYTINVSLLVSLFFIGGGGGGFKKNGLLNFTWERQNEFLARQV